MKQQPKPPALPQWLLPPVPPHLRRNQLDPDAQGLAQIGQAIRTHGKPADKLDQQYQLQGELNAYRRSIVPWLDQTCGLRGQQILEIGCGTGASSVALAEQGAKVLGLGWDAGSLEMARRRADAYVVEAAFLPLHPKALRQTCGDKAFDSIIFYNSLGKMTLAERLLALRDAWHMLPVGGLLAIIRTPNRLWWWDHHTAALPFFHWLPDALALRYARFSPQATCRALPPTCTRANLEQLLRLGRGISFHELELAIKPVAQLRVASTLTGYWGWRHWLLQPASDRCYQRLLQRSHPHLHRGFCEAQLNLVLEKRP